MRVLLVLGAALAVLGFVVMSILALRPPPTLTLAAGSAGGGYYSIGERYRSALAADGLTLTLRETAGSAENAELLADPDSGVDAILLQGGVPLPEGTAAQTLAAVFLEPLWIFHAGAVPPNASLAELSGLRLAIGAEGSGTRKAVLTILARLDLALDAFELRPLGGQAAADALLAGEIDVAFFVAPAEAGYLRDLIASERTALVPLRYAGAIARLVDDVDLRVLPAAGLDYPERRPSADVAMLAMVGRLVARADMHPAHVNRLVVAAKDIHARSDILVDAGHFPRASDGQPPMGDQAAALVARGPQISDRLLPYWMAAQINRVALLLLPLLLLVMPILRALPGLYTWRMRARIYRHYRDLLALEAEANAATDATTRESLTTRLDALEAAVLNTKLPLRFNEYAYTLRLHIDLIRRRLQES